MSVACRLADRAVEFDVRLDPVLYIQYLSLSIICHHVDFRNRLERLQRHQYTNPNIGSDEAFYLAAEAMAFLSTNQATAAQTVTAKALDRVRSDGMNKLVRSAMEPILMLAAAVANKDADGLVAAADARYEDLKTTYSPRASRGYPSGLLDVCGVAMLMLARQHGIQVTPSNVYMPGELIEG